MANTFSQIYLHITFAVKGRYALISRDVRPRVHAFIAGIVKDHGHFPIAVGGTDDHVHILLSYNLNRLIPDLMREVKASTTKFINNNRLCGCKFMWQRGYGCFSYSHSHIEQVKHYVENQEQHHYGESYFEEIKYQLDARGIEYDAQYILDE